jgi:hypothetical protein
VKPTIAPDRLAAFGAYGLDGIVERSGKVGGGAVELAGRPGQRRDVVAAGLAAAACSAASWSGFRDRAIMAEPLARSGSLRFAPRFQDAVP